jgi:glycosyltransferase involved in cell wall biosynthesis
MNAIAFAVPGSLDTPTGGYRYDRRVIAELRALGHGVEVVTFAGRFPDPTPDEISDAEARIAALPAGMPVIIDALAFGVMPQAVERLARERAIIALVHHPLALETGLSPDRVDALRQSELAALKHARSVVVTSPATADLLVDGYEVNRSRIAVALPGVDPPQLPRARKNDRFRFLSVGSLIPRKGYFDLIAAYGRLTDLDWHADIVGDPSLDPAHAAEVSRRYMALGLGDRVTMLGALAEDILATRYAEADCFVLASHYEGYGIAYTEAIMHGLPVIGTTGASEAIGDGGAKIAPGDIDGLTDVLRRVVSDAGFRAELADKARKRAAKLPRWSDAAEIISGLIAALA